MRFITAGPDVSDSGILLSTVNPEDWITKIRLWPGLKPAEVKSLKKIVEAFTPNIECSRSDLFGDWDATGTDSATIFTSLLEEAELELWKSGKDEIPFEMKAL